jgi:hypothetical protein
MKDRGYLIKFLDILVDYYCFAHKLHRDVG